MQASLAHWPVVSLNSGLCRCFAFTKCVRDLVVALLTREWHGFASNRDIFKIKFYFQIKVFFVGRLGLVGLEFRITVSVTFSVSYSCS